ncbi:MAG: DUF4870 domain-containing protein [Ferruginibacter sp.]
MEEKNYLGADTEPMIVPTSDEKTIAILSHALTFVAGFLAPLIIYLIKKDESEFIREHAKESLNFQITLFIMVIVLFVTIIGILLIWLVGILALILVILASVKCSEGKLYRYPFTLRLIK